MALNTKGMKKKRVGVITRRRFIKTTLAGAGLAGTGSLIFPRYGAAKPKTLKIIQWVHYVPRYDKWFNETYVKEWGENLIEMLSGIKPDVEANENTTGPASFIIQDPDGNPILFDQHVNKPK